MTVIFTVAQALIIKFTTTGLPGGRMKTSDFTYNLPEERIAKYPPTERGTTNLLVVDRSTGKLEHKKYFNVIDYINPGDVIVLNHTKVQNVRTFPTIKRTGRQVELMFLENIQYQEEALPAEARAKYEYWYALIGRARHAKIGDVLQYDGVDTVDVVNRKEGETGFIVRIAAGSSTALFNKYGHVPLPPYMHRSDEESDKTRYNTVFAKELGSVAAPTASLNLTNELLQQLNEKGVKIAYVNLSVGWGTFAPVNTDQVEDFQIHHEEYELPEESAALINETIKAGGDVWAFGTTATRVLETSAIRPVGEPIEGEGKQVDRFVVKAGSGDTNIFIYPGYEWKIVDHLVTNFHASSSSLLMLVSSFAGYDLIMKSYQVAIEKEYNFLSYGDSMLIL